MNEGRMPMRVEVPLYSFSALMEFTFEPRFSNSTSEE
jgi:hypothetical protein